MSAATLSRAVERLQDSANGWTSFGMVRRDDLTAVLDELARVRAEALSCVLGDHESLKAQLEIARHVSSTELNRLAQYFYEEGDGRHGFNVAIHMTGKAGLVDGLEAALSRIGIHKVHRPENWKVEYGHPDCAECEDCAEQAISYAKAAGTRSNQTVKSAFDGHFGSVERA